MSRRPLTLAELEALHADERALSPRSPLPWGRLALVALACGVTGFALSFALLPPPLGKSSSAPVERSSEVRPALPVVSATRAVPSLEEAPSPEVQPARATAEPQPPPEGYYYPSPPGYIEAEIEVD